VPDDLPVQRIAAEQVLCRAPVDAAGHAAVNPRTGLDGQDGPTRSEAAAFFVNRVEPKGLLERQILQLVIKAGNDDAGDFDILCHVSISQTQ
jgi:hypothetical protein